MTPKAPGRARTKVVATPKTLGELIASSAIESVTAEKVGNRIVAARKRQSMKQSELAEKTGLSRTVINGYERGRHLPGTRELALICDALKESPNELLYGVNDPFSVSNSDWASGSVSIGAAIMIAQLEQNEREAVLTLVRSLVEFRHGRELIELAGRLGPALSEMLTQAGPGIVRELKATQIGPAMQDLIEQAEASTKSETAKADQKARQRRAIKRSR